MKHFHWFASVFLLVAAIPLAQHARWPLHYPWGAVFFIAPFGFLVHGIVAAAFLYVVSSPRKFWKKLTTRGEKAAFPFEQLVTMILSTTYLFAAFTLILTYNDIIAALRFNGSGDRALERADAWILRGQSVVGWAHALLALHPNWFAVIEDVYLLMFPLVGGCLVILAVSEGAQRTFAFVGTGLTASYIALVLFYLVPAAGPFLYDHSLIWPRNSLVYELQMVEGANLPLFQHGYRPTVIGSDYFIALPCMHFVEVIVAWWFLRRDKALAWVFAIYGTVLIPCIFLLEEHYVVDVIAAFPVAALAIAVVDGFGRGSASTKAIGCKLDTAQK